MPLSDTTDPAPIDAPGDPAPEEAGTPEMKAGLELPAPPRDLEFCPRCGVGMDEILWGNTNCPNCGLHFECC